MGLPIAVMITGNDSLIMRHQVQATADYFAVQPVVLPGVAHDLMLVRLCDNKHGAALAAVQQFCNLCQACHHVVISFNCVR